MKIKVSEATGKVLNYLVAVADGHGPRWDSNAEHFYMGIESAYCFLFEYAPSDNWAQGGPIISKMLDSGRFLMAAETGQSQVTFIQGANIWTAYGSTPLIAFMRCIVASKLGDKVDVPGELLA